MNKIAIRLLNGSDVRDSCLIWRKLNHHGYGRIGIGPRVFMAHRIAWELANGPIPAGLQIDHICRNRGCVRPDHLRPVTNKENQENRSAISTDGRSGIRGVSWSTQKNRWVVHVVHNRKKIYYGSYTTIADAEEAAIAARNECFTHNNADRASA